MDIAGENPAYNTPLLGYDCTGRWNQLFKLTENCTILAQQPGVIGRVRGQGDKSIVSCLDSRHTSGVILTAECDHLTPAAPATNSSTRVNNTTVAEAAEAGVEAGLEVGVGLTGAVTAANGTRSVTQNSVRNFTSHQQFQFMPATGTAFKEFMK